MRPLVLDDLLPLAEYASRRREFFEAHQRYVDRRRRVRIGPSLTLVFENRQTMWFRVQEIVRIARLCEARLIQRELDLCNRLLPAPNHLGASLLIDLDKTRLTAELQSWQTLCGDHIRMHVGKTSIPADLLTCRPEDRCAGTAYWLQFSLPPALVRILQKSAVRFEVAMPHYEHVTKAMTDEIRASLAEDLEMSARDAA
jgi:hypothetical protein